MRKISTMFIIVLTMLFVSSCDMLFLQMGPNMRGEQPLDLTPYDRATLETAFGKEFVDETEIVQCSFDENRNHEVINRRQLSGVYSQEYDKIYINTDYPFSKGTIYHEIAHRWIKVKLHRHSSTGTIHRGGVDDLPKGEELAEHAMSGMPFDIETDAENIAFYYGSLYPRGCYVIDYKEEYDAYITKVLKLTPMGGGKK